MGSLPQGGHCGQDCQTAAGSVSKEQGSAARSPMSPGRVLRATPTSGRDTSRRYTSRPCTSRQLCSHKIPVHLHEYVRAADLALSGYAVHGGIWGSLL